MCIAFSLLVALSLALLAKLCVRLVNLHNGRKDESKFVYLLVLPLIMVAVPVLSHTLMEFFDVNHLEW